MTANVFMAPGRTLLTMQLVIGLTVMFVGAVLTLDVIGLIEAGSILRFWPIVLVGLGLTTIVHATERSGVFGGVMLATFGALLLLSSLHILPFRAFRLYWPFILVLVGGGLVMHAFRGAAESRPADAGMKVTMMSMMGGGDKVSTANPLRGGDLMAFMGGGKLDLRNATIPRGEQAIIDVVSLMGGFEILVPDSWVVDDRTFPIMGGTENTTRPPVDPSAPRLVVRGVVIMSGVDFKN